MRADFASRADISAPFKARFPAGAIRTADLLSIPAQARERFEGYSRRFIPPSEYAPGNFHQVYAISDGGVESVFAATQTKKYASGGVEQLVYLHEMEGDDYLGHGEIRFKLSQKSFFKDKPFVGYTETRDDLWRRGFGLRRLRLMNALSQALWQLPLNSDKLSLLTFDDTLDDDPATGVWKKLVTLREAALYKEPRPDEIEAWQARKKGEAYLPPHQWRAVFSV